MMLIKVCAAREGALCCHAKPLHNAFYEDKELPALSSRSIQQISLMRLLLCPHITSSINCALDCCKNVAQW